MTFEAETRAFAEDVDSQPEAGWDAEQEVWPGSLQRSGRKCNMVGGGWGRGTRLHWPRASGKKCHIRADGARLHWVRSSGSVFLWNFLERLLFLLPEPCLYMCPGCNMMLEIKDGVEREDPRLKMKHQC